MKSLLQDAADRAIAYLDSLPERAVRPDATAVAKLSELCGAFPLNGQDAAMILSEIDRVGGRPLSPVQARAISVL